MTLDNVVAQIDAEIRRLMQARSLLAGLAVKGATKKPAKQKAVKAAKKAGKRKISAAGRKAIAAAQRKRWAAIKAAKSKVPF